MIKFVILLSAFIIGTATSSSTRQRVSIEDVPYMVSLEYEPNHGYGHFYNGPAVLIAPNVVLADSNAVPTIINVTKWAYVRAGHEQLQSDGEIRRIKNIIWYGKQYTDLAILVLEKSFSVSDKIRPISIAFKKDQLPETGMLATWGGLDIHNINNDYLQVIKDVPVLEKDIKFANNNRDFFRSNDTTKPLCLGDAGAAFTNDSKLYGFITLRVQCLIDNGPTVFHRIPYYSEWIRTTLAQL